MPKKAAEPAVPDAIVKTRKPGPGLTKPYALSPELAAVAGAGPMPRTEVVAKVWAYINHAPPRTGAAEPSIVTEARETLAHMGATVADTVIAQRVALSHAIISGSTVNEYEPDGRAAAEVAALWREVQTYLKA